VIVDASTASSFPVHSPVDLPLALYVHVPFCVRKCYYCDFASGPAPAEIRGRYVAALEKEIRATEFRGLPARTVFFGGGTPSELDGEQLHRLTAALRETFPMVGADTPLLVDPEWTIECNPGSTGASLLSAMRGAGFNRLSLGVQSFHDHHLRALGRIHTAEEARGAVVLARAAGFRRLNLDLIFCLPGQTMREWQADVEEALRLHPEHLSLYNLTIEEETEFGRRYRSGLLTLPDEDLSADMYEWAIDRLAGEGYALYEVSNFALPGEECRHNQVYWRREPSLGFGLGAASFAGGIRWTTTRSMQRYLASVDTAGVPERDIVERLEPRAAAGEEIMLALRTAEGADLEAICRRHDLSRELFGEAVEKLLAERLLQRRGNTLCLTRRGLLVANAVCGEFLA
jgi:oxygen-independent coproporphyrinogen-3 oxidase